jgi:hypothetical protein
VAFTKVLVSAINPLPALPLTTWNERVPECAFAVVTSLKYPPCRIQGLPGWPGATPSKSSQSKAPLATEHPPEDELELDELDELLELEDELLELEEELLELDDELLELEDELDDELLDDDDPPPLVAPQALKVSAQTARKKGFVSRLSW